MPRIRAPLYRLLLAYVTPRPMRSGCCRKWPAVTMATLIIALISGCAATGMPESAAERHYQSGREALARENYHGARKAFEHAREQASTRELKARANLQLAWLAYQAGDADRAASRVASAQTLGVPAQQRRYARQLEAQALDAMWQESLAQPPAQPRLAQRAFIAYRSLARETPHENDDTPKALARMHALRLALGEHALDRAEQQLMAGEHADARARLAFVQRHYAHLVSTDSALHTRLTRLQASLEAAADDSP